jgi:hypothetical protein
MRKKIKAPMLRCSLTRDRTKVRIKIPPQSFHPDVAAAVAEEIYAQVATCRENRARVARIPRSIVIPYYPTERAPVDVQTVIRHALSECRKIHGKPRTIWLSPRAFQDLIEQIAGERRFVVEQPDPDRPQEDDYRAVVTLIIKKSAYPVREERTWPGKSPCVIMIEGSR